MKISQYGIEPARPLDPGMGMAVARRTVFRPADAEDMGRVADRVALGNLRLVPEHMTGREFVALRNAIAAGRLITSGRHLQHGDEDQPGRNLECFSNCSSAAFSFAKFYLLLNGSGVGRSYDDDLMVVDWSYAPALILVLSPDHPDYPATPEQLYRFAVEFAVVPHDLPWTAFDADHQRRAREARDRLFRPAFPASGPDIRHHTVADSREGWAQALERYESLTYERWTGGALVLDFSPVRPLGAPIAGMQNRPASGPLSVMRAFHRVREHVVGRIAEPWRQAMHVDHHFSVEVQVGGARRAARMSTKSWRDPGIFDFIRIKAEGGLWTSNNSVTVDAEFWRRVAAYRYFAEGAHGDPAEHLDPLDLHAWAVFQAATRSAWHNGEPGFINGDRLEGRDRPRPVHADGRDLRSRQYRVGAAQALIGDVAARAARTRFPMITNPCGEVALHVLGGYCLIGDTIPLFSAPYDLLSRQVGAVDAGEARIWDDRAEEAVRLGVRFLMRANRMDSLYGEEVRRTQRIGLGPTGLMEYALARFGFGFRDLLDEARARPFWAMLARLSAAAKDEAARYAADLGVEVPHTVTTVKPAGTTSKLYGLCEGAHLPARRWYLRWVQFRGIKIDGHWTADSDPLLARYEAAGYPVRANLRGFPNMSIVGFPTVPLILRLPGALDQVVTAREATPAEQYRWLRLLETHWLGERQGNQVSYTLKVDTHTRTLDGFREIVRTHQPTIRACSILPYDPERELGYEYLPEEEVSWERFQTIVAGLRDDRLHQEIDLGALQCASGACPL